MAGAIGSSSDGHRHYFLTTEERERYDLYKEREKDFDKFIKENNNEPALTPDERHRKDQDLSPFVYSAFQESEGRG